MYFLEIKNFYYINKNKLFRKNLLIFVKINLFIKQFTILLKI